MKCGMYKSFDRIRFKTPHPKVSKDDLVSTMNINRASVDRLRLQDLRQASLIEKIKERTNHSK